MDISKRSLDKLIESFRVESDVKKCLAVLRSNNPNKCINTEPLKASVLKEFDIGMHSDVSYLLSEFSIYLDNKNKDK